MTHRILLTTAGVVVTLAGLSTLVFAAEGEAVLVDCDEQAQRLTIKYLWDSDQKGWNDPERLVFFDLLDFERCPKGHRFEGDACYVSGLRSKTVMCSLGSERVSMTFEPLPFNDDLQGRCGAAVSGRVSIKAGEKAIAEVVFDESQDCLSEDVDVVSEVVITGPKLEVQIEKSPRG